VSADWFSEIWRAINGVLSLAALVLLIRQGRVLWGQMSLRSRMLTHAHQILLVGCLWGAVENLVQGNPIGGRTAFVTAGAGLTCIALLFVPHAFTRDEDDRNNSD
jgi:hypothetical protein